MPLPPARCARTAAHATAFDFECPAPCTRPPTTEQGKRTHEHHGHALGDSKCEVQVAHLALAQRIDALIISLALDAAVPGEIVVGAVAVALPVRIIVLLVVRHQVIEGEAIMRNDEVYPVRGLPGHCTSQQELSGQPA